MRKTITIAALLFIWLMMTLPVAYSNEILTIQKFSGIDGVNGYAKENDILTIQVLAEMLGNPTEAVAKQRARIYHDDTYEFMDACDPQAQAMQECAYITDDLIYGGKDEYEVKVYDESGNPIASEKRTLTVDFLGPKILTMAVSPNASTAPVLTSITYNVEDYGTTTGQKTNCAGIKMINFTAGGKTEGIVSGEIGECAKQGTFKFTPTVNSPSEVVTVCAVAHDYLNHKSLPTCKNILIDSQKPTPTELVLRDGDGYSITHARTDQIIVADVSVRIPDIDVNPSQVFADLSSLNPNIGRVARHAQSGEWFIWRDITITSPDTCRVTVDAKDHLGNSDTKTLTCSIGIDDDGPTPNNIVTQFADDDGTPILGANGTIYVDFTESGSGMDKANAYLDLRALGRGREVKANRCGKTSASTWLCEWDVIPTVSSGTYEVKLQPTTRDDLDNQASGTINQNIIFDNTAPGELTLVEIAAFRGDDRVRTNYTSLGETLEFVVSGAGYTDVRADLSDLGGRSDAPYEGCTENNLTVTCVFAVTTGVSGPQPTNVTFTFSDAAGNTARLSTTELFILGVTNETAPNYWTITTDCAPPLLDRTTLSLFEHPVYCRLAMTSTNSLASPITVVGPYDPFSDCTGDVDYLSDISVENNYAGSVEPYLALSLVATDYEINNLTLTCPVSTLTRVGNFIPQNMETDNATINLKFYNMPLGEMYNNIDSEVRGVENSIEGVWKIIGKLQKFFGYAEKLCNILNAIMGIITTIAVIMVIIGITATAVDAVTFGVGGQALHAVQNSMCNPTDAIHDVYENTFLKIFKKFCDFITCQAGLFDLLSATGIMGESAAGIAEADSTNWFYSVLDPADATNIQQQVAGSDTVLQNPNSYLNVKDSLIYSIVIPPLCIPGIVYNLDKWRQIQCRYGLCLLEDVREQGMPLSICKDQKSYMQCRFVMGEIFNLIPFAAIVNFYMNIIQQALSDPLVFVSMGLAYLLNCKAACEAPKGAGIVYDICAGMAIIAQLGQSIGFLKNMKGLTDFGEVNARWCDDFEDALDEYGSEK